MIKPGYHILPVLLVLAACSNTNSQSSGDTSYEALELAASNNLQCAWENQQRCSHVIENRALFARFFAPPTLGNMEEAEKNNGRRVTTRFIVEATAGINQCQKVGSNSIPLVKDVRIAGKGYRVEGTAPLSQASRCFLTPDPESP